MIDGDLSRWMERTVSRRQMLRGAGRATFGAGALAAFLAACGSDEPSAPRATMPTLPPVAGELSVAQWPLYIDRAREGHRPTLEAFEEEHDIAVDYREVIADNQEFFARLVPLFRQGQDTGWDIIALSDWVVGLMRDAGWLEAVHHDRLPNVRENLLPAFRDPLYDPGNARSVPWQGGVTGIAYYPDRTGFEIRRFADLWDDRLAGRVGMLTEVVDTVSLTLLMLGIEPQDATLDDVARATDRLIEQRESGVVRGYYGQDYANEMALGNTWATMAWSGDVFFYKYLGGRPTSSSSCRKRVA